MLHFGEYYVYNVLERKRQLKGGHKMKRKIVTSLMATSLAIILCTGVVHASGCKCKKKDVQPEKDITLVNEVDVNGEKIPALDYLNYNGVSYSWKDVESFEEVLIDKDQAEHVGVDLFASPVQGLFRNPEDGNYSGYITSKKFLVENWYIQSAKTQFANGITIGSSQEDVRATFGEPQSVTDNYSGGDLDLLYENDDVKVRFEIKDNAVLEIIVTSKATEADEEVSLMYSLVDKFRSTLEHGGGIFN